MTAYINGLDTSKDIKTDKPKYAFSKDGRVALPKNKESYDTIDGVVSVLVRDDELGVIIDEITQGSVQNVKLTQIDTSAEAVLSINYGGTNGYHARVTLGNGEKVSAQGGAETVVRKIVNYLSAPKQEVKKKTGKFPVVSRETVTVPEAEDRYSHLEAEFE